jgi:hypothetical protein
VARANQDSGVARYLRDIDKFPLLSSDEEQKLARRWRGRADPIAANRLVTSHLRYPAKVKVTDTPQKPDGSADTPTTFGWDIAGNVRIS